MYIKWLIFSCDLLSLYLALYFLNMCLSDIIAIMNSKRDSASAWNKLLWIFVSAKLFTPVVDSTFLVFKVFSIKFMTSSDILYILRQLCGTISYDWCSQSGQMPFFSVSSCSRWGGADQCRVPLPCLSILCSILSVPHGLFVRNKFLPIFVPLVFSTS